METPNEPVSFSSFYEALLKKAGKEKENERSKDDYNFLLWYYELYKEDIALIPDLHKLFKIVLVLEGIRFYRNEEGLMKKYEKVLVFLENKVVNTTSLQELIFSREPEGKEEWNIADMLEEIENNFT